VPSAAILRLAVTSHNREGLVSLRCWADLESVDLYEYQVEAAKRVVYELGGRALLADEVGLGKTIEAGLIMLELIMVRDTESILILTPASLVNQWYREFKEKFDLEFLRNPRGDQWRTATRILTSIDRAKREPRRTVLTNRSFDLLVVDEAHSLKNAATLNHRLVKGIESEQLLLLSATPLQNDLVELYNLGSLVRPDLFGTEGQFRRKYLIDKRTPRDVEKLKKLLSKVMIRNNRESVKLQFSERQAALLPIALSSAEQYLYDEVTQALRRQYWQKENSRSILPLLTLQREICSSTAALVGTLNNLSGPTLQGERERLARLADGVEEWSKAETLEALVPTIGQKVIVFTEFRATQQQLARRLQKEGIRVTTFHGGLTAEQKDAAQEEFRKETQVLISTECGGQGLNLQFCPNVVNYDLPWNPMRVEQRIGRVHRLGQKRRVRIYNLCARNTIEEHIVRLLDQKIDLFRRVVGNLDLILRQLERARSFEHTVLDIALTSRDASDMKLRFEELGRQLAGAARSVRSENVNTIDDD
jgi:SNF2 family DNA or RNA helicase